MPVGSWWCRIALLVGWPVMVAAQTPAPLDFVSDDSSRIAFVTAHGAARHYPGVTVWSVTDSLDPAWLASFTDSLATSLIQLRALVGGPYLWQRISTRPLVYFFSPGRFISHATGQDTIFISLSHIRRGEGPFLHEAAHELLMPPAPFYPYEAPDSAAEARAARQFPQWLNEGLPDYLAQTAAGTTGFREGDIFAVGGLARVDSVCAVRLRSHPRRREIAAHLGRLGRFEALYTTDRAALAPTFYACSQSLTKYLVERVGVRGVVSLFPRIPTGTWLEDLTTRAGASLSTLRLAWLRQLAISDEPPP